MQKRLAFCFREEVTGVCGLCLQGQERLRRLLVRDDSNKEKMRAAALALVDKPISDKSTSADDGMLGQSKERLLGAREWIQIRDTEK